MKPHGSIVGLLICAFLASTSVRGEETGSSRPRWKHKPPPNQAAQVEKPKPIPPVESRRKVAPVESRIILKDPAEVFSQVSNTEIQYPDPVTNGAACARSCTSATACTTVAEMTPCETFETDPIFVNCVPYSDDGCSVGPRRATGLYAQVDAMFLHLAGSNSTIVPTADFFLDPTSTGTPIQAIQDGQYRVVPRVTIGCADFVNIGWEMTYFGRNDWQKSAVNNTSDGPQYSSLATAFQSAEANFLKSIDEQSTVQLLAGFRWFQFDEHLDLLLYPNSLTANSAVANNLFGGQFGARVSRQWMGWNFAATGKFGVFQDFAMVHETSLAAGTSTTSAFNGTSFMTDLGATASYPITQALSVRLGYQFLMLDGIARAAGQIDRGGALPSVNANDNCILHGPTAGFEFRY